MPYIGLANIESEFGTYIETIEEEPEGTCRIFEEGQVLYGKLRPYLNKVYIAQGSGQCSTEFYCLKAKNSSQLNQSFLAAFLMSEPFLSQTIHMMTGNTHPRIQREDFEEILIPLPSIDIQCELAAEINAARESRKQKLQQAEQLINSLDAYLLETLGLTQSLAETRKTFAVKSGQLKGNRIDATSYQPFFSEVGTSRSQIVPLSELAFIDVHRANKPEGETTLVPYIGLPECSQTEVQDVVLRPYSEVKGRSVIKPGDILFARIEPSVFNKKYVLAEDLKGHDYAYTSTEFYVVTPNPDMGDPYYLYAMFFCAFVFNQVKGQTTGSSGRRRLSPEAFRNLQIPKPAMKVQRTIAAEVRRRREKAQRLKAEAEAKWLAAKVHFEDELLKPSASTKCS